jgi:uncharacterized protein (TIGR02300 family)
MKRTCQGCGVRFYDLLRDPIYCPKCGSLYDPEAVLKSRRTRAVAEKAPKLAVKEDVELETTEVGIEEEGIGKEAEEDEELMEDTSELGEDDDMAQVIDTVDEEER